MTNWLHRWYKYINRRIKRTSIKYKISINSSFHTYQRLNTGLLNVRVKTHKDASLVLKRFIYDRTRTEIKCVRESDLKTVNWRKRYYVHI